MKTRLINMIVIECDMCMNYYKKGTNQYLDYKDIKEHCLSGRFWKTQMMLNELMWIVSYSYILTSDIISTSDENLFRAFIQLEIELKDTWRVR